MKIGIIGGGLSGTLLAIRLLKAKSNLPLTIHIIEKKHPIGRGVAYSTEKNFHLLNVRAEKMSAFPEIPDHFMKWLEKKKIDFTSTAHISRKIYGNYIEDNLIEAMASNSEADLKIIYDEATDATLLNEQIAVSFSSGSTIEYDKIILALGNFPPGEFPFSIPEEKYCNDPWRCKKLEKLARDKTILIIGTGLTMVDTCVTLAQKNHQGEILSISGHGYLPQVHEYSGSYLPFFSELENKETILEIFNLIKKRIKGEKGNWRNVIDSLRPYTQILWQGLSDSEKKIFLKKLNRIWNIARHRIPHEYSKTLQSLIANKQLNIHSGRIMNIKNENGQLQVEFKSHGKKEFVAVDFIINCTGPQINYEKINNMLVKNLLAKKIIQTTSLKMGIEATAEGRVISNNKVSDKIFTLGPPLTGVLFETTAVPEIREQAKNLARILINLNQRKYPNTLLNYDR